MSEWTIIVACRARQELASELTAAGLDVLLTDDLNNLPPDHPTTAELRTLTGPLVVAAELYPRAAYWLLSAKGVTGRRADGPKTKTSGRAVYCVDLTGLSTEEARQRVLAAAAQPLDGEPLAARSLRDLRAGVPELWHSVIDFDRCINCLQCAEFCLFGVYDIRPDGTPYVANPDKCKPGCPACSRVCPAAAIIFPRYHARGPIAGDDEGRPQQLDGQAARQTSGPDVQAYRAQHGLDQPAQLGLPVPRPGAAPAQNAPPAVAPARDDTSVDAMIRELEGFDA